MEAIALPPTTVYLDGETLTTDSLHRLGEERVPIALDPTAKTRVQAKAYCNLYHRTT